MDNEVKEYIKDIFEEIPENYHRVGKYFFMCGVIVTLYRRGYMSDDEYENAVLDLGEWNDADKDENGEELYVC